MSPQRHHDPPARAVGSEPREALASRRRGLTRTAFGISRLMPGPGRVVLRVGSSQFELGQSCYIAEKTHLVSINVPRPDIACAKGSNAASREEEREANIEANARFSGHERIIREAHILERVRHDQHLARRHCVSAQRDVARSLADLESTGRFEPLAILVYKAYEGHRHIQNCSGEAREPVEAQFARRIEDAQAMQSGQPPLLVLR